LECTTEIPGTPHLSKGRPWLIIKSGVPRTKDSCFGREGVRYAIEEMTELELLAINTQ